MSIEIENTVSLQVFSDIYTGGTPDRSVSRYWEHGTIPWINSGSVNQGTILDPSALITVEAFERSSTSWARKEDLVIALAGQGRTKGMVAQMGIDACVNQSMAVIKIRPESAFVSRFVFYAVDCQYRKIRFMAGGDKRDGINLTHVGAIRIPFFPMETQQRIADYLDQETAEIDAAVAELERYVALLEKRKLSRIESALNEISYRMCPVGLLADVTLGKMVSTTPPKVGGLERQYLRAAHVQPGGRLDFTVAEKKMWFSEKELERLDLLAGDVVVVEGGAGFGRSAYLESDLEEWGFQNSINRVRVDPSRVDGRFVQLMLNRALLNGSIGISVDTATLPHFTAEKLARFRIPICDIQKQKELSQEIHEDTLTTNSLIEESIKLRDLLLKRRSVLITEVVTGRKQV